MFLLSRLGVGGELNHPTNRQYHRLLLIQDKGQYIQSSIPRLPQATRTNWLSSLTAVLWFQQLEGCRQNLLNRDGIQSTIFSPALNGSIPELYPESYVIKANSVLKSLTTSGILVGTIAAGLLLKYKTPVWGFPCGRVGVAGAVVGTLCAVVLTRWLSTLPTVSGYIQGAIPPVVIAQGFAIAILVGLIGGVYPAYRGASLAPTEAIRHE